MDMRRKPAGSLLREGKLAGLGLADVFADHANGDFHHKAGSPAIDGGSDALFNYFFDAEGNPRPLGSALDIGAYEQPLD